MYGISIEKNTTVVYPFPRWLIYLNKNTLYLKSKCSSLRSTALHAIYSTYKEESENKTTRKEKLDRLTIHISDQGI